MTKKVLVIGASANPDRFSFAAIHKLIQYGHGVVAIGNKDGVVNGIKIETNKTIFTDIHTVTLYINPNIQLGYYDYLLQLNPKRVIFNPGTYNKELESLLKNKGIAVIENCTLVMLDAGSF